MDWVRSRRGEKLTGSPTELFSGEVFSGTKAARLGLVDGLGTLRGVIGERYPSAQIVVAEPRRPLLARLGVGTVAARTEFGRSPAEHMVAVVEALEQRALWSRFGL